MPKNMFDKRKQDILGKKDKSFIKRWDKKIVGLCEKLNKNKNYYTTSSCSGRVVLIIDSDKKTHGLFLKIYHNLVSFDELKRDLNDILISSVSNSRHPTPQPLSRRDVNINRSTKNFIDNNKKKDLNINFKQEPCGLHVACRALKDAQILVTKARKVGWKKSGIISSDKRFIVEIFGTGVLGFPIIKSNKILIDDNFLREIVNKSNINLKKSWDQIEKLKKSI